ncbi:tyrosine-type recombinase/integrase (plasmid) [Ralstonia syzygii subsp. celebesensis]|uniref:Putative integrase/recombinase protein from phage n=1 Tax=blood disease bacterium R229 TaxID=741978 RepID=G2ZW15_9RALS|nr:site-specific integrase [Ralstonia syzygii]QQV57870.1 site-specific integrase [Ralstonia syzygii subsp. celebesensis]CCA83299.1 putative integrase/recombinase protein from phage [blood disease bacterium R229]
MGTVFPRTDNAGKTTFQARVRRKGFPALSKNFPTEAAAKRWVREREAELELGISSAVPQDTKTYTLSELIDRYIKEVTPHKKGHAVEETRLRALQRTDLAKLTLPELDRTHFKVYKDARLRVVAGSTVNRELNTLSHIIDVARKEWGISAGDNPVKDVSRPKNPPPRDRRLSPKEQVALFAAIADTRGGYLRHIVELALETGMRQSELVGLEWERVSLPKRTIRLMVGRTKNGHGRAVPLSRRAIEILESLAPEGGRRGDVFPGVTTEAVKRAFIRSCQRAGLEDFHFHDLRHEATSRLFEKDLGVAEVASITGHKDTRMLMRYTHLDASKLADKLG